MKKLGKSVRTARGFELIEFYDYNHDSCSLQQSSLADTSAIWLGCNENAFHSVTKEPLGPRMHLNFQQVKALVGHLQSWIDYGTFNPPKKK